MSRQTTSPAPAAAVAAGTGWRLASVIHNGQRYRACPRRSGWSA